MCCVKGVSIVRSLAVIALPAALLLGLGLGSPPARADGPGVVLEGEPEVVFAGGKGNCGDDFIPDAPVRAFRTADGRVAVIAAYFVNRLLRGPDLDHLTPDCQVAYRGAESTDPAAYNDHDWIAAPYTLDGVTVHALVHDEFWGHRRPDLCPAKSYMACWYNKVTEVVSTDGGQSFRRVGLAAAAPYRYDGTLGRHVGYFNPSNIIAWNGWYYATMFATEWGAQPGGNCLIRTNNLDDLSSWRGWDGKAFSVRFVDAYRETNFAPEKHVCAPVGPLKGPVGSIVRHRGSGLFVATMAANDGFYYSTSGDLIHWAAPRLLWSVTLSGQQGCNHPWAANYPALLDPGSPDRNFDSVGDRPWLYFTRFWAKDCGLTMKRDLMRVRVRIGG
jgi:hypothetical protein